MAQQKKSLLKWIGIGAISLVLGIASGFSQDGFSWLAFFWHTAVLAALQAVFFVLLPGRMKPPIQILLAMVAGTLAGLAIAAAGDMAFVTGYIGIYGTIFILMLKLVVLPLIFVSIVLGVSGIGDVSRLGRLGGKAIGYYLCTTCVAVAIGMVCVNALQPGARTETEQTAPAADPAADPAAAALAEASWKSFGAFFQEDVLPTIIQNPIMAGQSPLVIIFFALFLGAALAAGGKSSRATLDVFDGLDKAFVQIVMWIMTLAPIGVFCLMAVAIVNMGVDLVGKLALYSFSVVLGLGVHWFFLVFLLLGLLLRVSPMRFIRGMGPALELAFSTSSSTATLPVTIECASKRLNVDEDIAGFMLPVGATINMDGSALYQSVAAIFIAQVYGYDLSIAQQFSIFFMAVAMSIGAAGIPGAAFALLPLILDAAGVNVELWQIGIVAGVDRLLDMCRTFINVTGDSVGTVLIAKTEGALGPPIEAGSE